MSFRCPGSATRFLAAAAVAAGLAACGSASATTSSTTVPSTRVATSSSVPPGTTLRIGDQLNYLKTVLSISGQDTNFPYQVQYSQFVGGPPMLQAFQGGALDLGFVGSTPLIFAQAAGQPLTAVAAWSTKESGYTLVTAPGTTSVTGWGSLKGKRVAYQVGTAAEAVLLEGLSSVGLTLKDVTTVNLPVNQTAAALQGHSADAALSVEPLTSVYLATNPSARQVARVSQVTDRTDFVLTDSAALSNRATSAALADYLRRLVTAFGYLRAHPQAITQAVYVDQYHLSPARAAVVSAQIGAASFVPLPGDIVPAQQHLADLFRAAGQIPNKIDVASEFDPRFNALVSAAQGA